MAYIGRTKTPAPLTSADIPDGIVTAADLAPNSVDTSEIADSVTLVTPNLGTPSAVTLTNATFPDDHILYFKHTVIAASGGSHTNTSYSTTGGVAVTVPAVTCNAMDNLTIIFNTFSFIGNGAAHTDIGIRGDRSAPSAVNYQEQVVGSDDESTSAHRIPITYVIYDDSLSNADHTYRLQSKKGWGGSSDAGNISINGYGVNILVIGKK